jgi:hypothetical protein
VAERGARFPVAFAEVAWSEDLARTSETGRAEAAAARKRYEREGIPQSELRPCDAEARDGTNLAGCVKVYVPAPAGPFGLVLEVARTAEGRVGLMYVAFGTRHQPRGSRAPSVYAIAHQRIHGRAPAPRR